MKRMSFLLKSLFLCRIQRGIAETYKIYKHKVLCVMSQRYIKKYRGIKNGAVSEEYDIAICINGGIGDILLSLNYVLALKQKLQNENVRFQLFFLSSKNSIETLVSHVLEVEAYQYFTRKDLFRNIDILISLTPYFPEVMYTSDRTRECLNIKKYIDVLEEFRTSNKFLFEDSLKERCNKAGSYCISNNIKRIQSLDVGGYLDISDSFIYRLPVKESNIERYGLSEKKYITIHRGCDAMIRTLESTKMWPISSYCQLIGLIKHRYPTITIVQVGSKDEERIPEIDLYLNGKTSLEDMKGLLAQGIVHIDNEGGMVHLQRVVGDEKAVVLFGPTSERFFGYNENINISKSDKCVYNGCHWLTDTWQEICVNTENRHICMNSITAKEVFEAVSKVIDEE